MEQPGQRTFVKMPVFQHVAILAILIRSASIIKILLSLSMVARILKKLTGQQWFWGESKWDF